MSYISTPKVTATERAILIISNSILLLCIFVILVALIDKTSTSIITGIQLLALVILIVGIPLLIVPWFILALVNFLKNRSTSPQKTIALFVSAASAMLYLVVILLCYKFPDYFQFLESIVDPYRAIYSASLAIILSDILFFYFHRKYL